MVNLPPDMYMRRYEYMACPSPREVSTNVNIWGKQKYYHEHLAQR